MRASENGVPAPQRRHAMRQGLICGGFPVVATRCVQFGCPRFPGTRLPRAGGRNMSAISSRRDAESTFQSTGEKVYAIPCDAKDSRLGASRVPGSPRVRHVKGRASRVSGRTGSGAASRAAGRQPDVGTSGGSPVRAHASDVPGHPRAQERRDFGRSAGGPLGSPEPWTSVSPPSSRHRNATR